MAPAPDTNKKAMRSLNQQEEEAESPNTAAASEEGHSVTMNTELSTTTTTTTGPSPVAGAAASSDTRRQAEDGSSDAWDVVNQFLPDHTACATASSSNSFGNANYQQPTTTTMITNDSSLIKNFLIDSAEHRRAKEEEQEAVKKNTSADDISRNRKYLEPASHRPCSKQQGTSSSSGNHDIQKDKKRAPGNNGNNKRERSSEDMRVSDTPTNTVAITEADMPQPFPSEEDQQQRQPGAVRVDGMYAPDDDVDSESVSRDGDCGSANGGGAISRSEDESDPEMQMPHSSQHDILIEATLVTNSAAFSSRNSHNEDSKFLVEAEPMEDMHTREEEMRHVVQHNKRLRRCMIIGGVMFIAVSLALGLALGLVGLQQEQESSDPPVEVVKRRPPFRDDIPYLTADEVTERPHGPHAFANEWMLDDPNLKNYSDSRQVQRYAMAHLYYAFDGNSWFHSDHWLDYSMPECDWYSSHPTPVCDDFDVLKIMNLTSNNLQGDAHDLVGFPDVKILDYSNNQMRGNLPSVSSDFARHLEVVIVSNNSFTGQRSVELGFTNPNLRVLRYDGNMFTGQISGAILQLAPNLMDLDVSRNRMHGTLPDAFFGPESSIEILKLADNNISGAIPWAFYESSTLKELDISGNPDINGAMDQDDWSGLTNLTSVDFTGTMLTGTIPDNVCDLVAGGALQLDVDCDIIDCCQS